MNGAPTVERGFQGQWIVSGVDSSGHLVVRSFFGYSRRAAVALWRQAVRGR